jgi:hypothetical protein
MTDYNSGWEAIILASGQASFAGPLPKSNLLARLDIISATRSLWGSNSWEYRFLCGTQDAARMTRSVLRISSHPQADASILCRLLDIQPARIEQDVRTPAKSYKRALGSA